MDIFSILKERQHWVGLAAVFVMLGGYSALCFIILIIHLIARGTS